MGDSDTAHRISTLNKDIEQLEAALQQIDKSKQALSGSQDQLLTTHLLAQSTAALAEAFNEENEEEEEESFEQQIAALAALSGISFTSIRNDAVQLSNGVSRQLRLIADTASLSFELSLVIQEPSSVAESAHITSAELTVPPEFRGELANLIESTQRSCAVTTMLRALARYSQAAYERRELFRAMKRAYPDWIVCPHGTNSAWLLSVRQPARTKTPFVFDFLWQLEVSPTGALRHTTQLIPRASQHCLDCDDDGVLEELPAQFKILAAAQGLHGALDILMAIVTNPGGDPK